MSTTKLYKYMPMNTLFEFLKDPCLRVTPSYCQNDPFEFGYSDKDISTLNSVSSQKLGNGIHNYAKWHGIVSLSSVLTDIPMWYHYAEKYMGAAVELRINKEKPCSLFINTTGFTPQTPDFIFDKVNYSNQRSCDSNSNIRQHYYFSKALSWSYEKEYRYIVPHNYINKIILIGKGKEKAERILKEYIHGIVPISKAESSSEKKVEDEKSHEKEKFHINPTTISTIIMEKPHLLAELWAECTDIEAMYFIRLNKKSIGPIYLGHKAQIDKFQNFFKEEHKEYGSHSILEMYYHLLSGDSKSIYKASLDNNNYCFNFDKKVQFSII